MSVRSRAERKAEVRRRADEQASGYGRCIGLGCNRPTRAKAGEGLDTRLCRRHYDHHQRHGDPFRSSYTAAQLAPWKKDAREWLKTHADHPWVQNAVLRVQGLYATAGRAVDATGLRGLPARERAKIAWARLRKAEIDPLKPVEAWLTVELAAANDPQGTPKREFTRVQAAKLVHRMASGTHKKWQPVVLPHPTDPFRTVSVPRELHAYPRSRGRVLRYIGEDLEEAAGLVADLFNTARTKEVS